MNLYHVSGVKNQVTSDFVKYISGLIFSSLAVDKVLSLFCYRFLVGFLTQVHEVFFLFTLQWPTAEQWQKERKNHVFIYWQKYGLEKQWHTDKSVPLTLGFFLLLSSQKIESSCTPSSLFNKKTSWPKSNNASYFQQSRLAFEMWALSTFIGIVQYQYFWLCYACGIMCTYQRKY